MKILAVETSCDETSAAIVVEGTQVLSHVLASSSNLFEETGGVVPEVAARKQLEYIIPIIDKALGDAKIPVENIDFFAVTVGPGLLGSLLVGVDAVKMLSLIYEKPIIPVNHLLGHIYSVFIQNYLGQQIQNGIPKFPLLVLVVSGGHTDLILMKDFLKIEYLGGTQDDAVGEAFDKVARVLDIERYLGGAKLSKIAESFEGVSNISLPRPMIGTDDFNFSFSGLKTAVIRLNEELENQPSPRHPEEERSDNEGSSVSVITADIAHEFEQAVVDVLVAKTKRAVQEYKPKSLAIVGGVSANRVLRKRVIEEFNDIDVFIPPVILCTDNAAMIGSAAYYLKDLATTNLSKINADSSLNLEKVFN